MCHGGRRGGSSLRLPATRMIVELKAAEATAVFWKPECVRLKGSHKDWGTPAAVKYRLLVRYSFSIL